MVVDEDRDARLLGDLGRGRPKHPRDYVLTAVRLAVGEQ